MAELRFQQVGKRFGAHAEVLRDVTLEIAQGEFCVFIGPSGCGKSTLLRMIAGLEEISSGDLSIGGARVNDLPPAQRGVAMVFQSYALYPHMTVYQNIAFGLRIQGQNRTDIDTRVRGAARVLQLEPLLDRLPKELSGGQRQRVAIGRAIVRQPRVFLFDEPLSNLDAELRAQTRLEIARLHADMPQSTMIYVTHDQVEAMTLADKIVLLNSGSAVQDQGSIAQCGSPLELYHHPVNRFVAGFIGSPKMNFIDAALLVAQAGRALFKVNGGSLEACVEVHGIAQNTPMTIGIRPEHAELRTADEGNNTFTATVAFVEKLGDASYVHVQRAGGPLFAIRVPGSARVRVGDRVGVYMDPANMHAFDANGLALPRSVRPEQA